MIIAVEFMICSQLDLQRSRFFYHTATHAKKSLVHFEKVEVFGVWVAILNK